MDYNSYFKNKNITATVIRYEIRANTSVKNQGFLYAGTIYSQSKSCTLFSIFRRIWMRRLRRMYRPKNHIILYPPITSTSVFIVER